MTPCANCGFIGERADCPRCAARREIAQLFRAIVLRAADSRFRTQNDLDDELYLRLRDLFDRLHDRFGNEP